MDYQVDVLQQQHMMMMDEDDDDNDDDDDHHHHHHVLTLAHSPENIALWSHIYKVGGLVPLCSKHKDRLYTNIRYIMFLY